MITASIVTYNNSKSDIERVLKSANSSCINKIYIIDHSNTDLFRSFEQMSPKIVYFHNVNIGYGGGNNIALNYAIKFDNSQYHFVLNSDIYFKSEVITNLVKYLDSNPDIGMIMPKVLNLDGSVQFLPKLLPTPFNLLIRIIKPLQRIFKLKNQEYTLENYQEQELNVPIISGCFSLFRVDALKNVGLYDEKYFMYFEDFDLSRRIHSKYKTIYYPSESIIHAHERGAAKSFKLFTIFIKSAFIYFNKYGWFFDPERKRINKIVLKSLK